MREGSGPVWKTKTLNPWPIPNEAIILPSDTTHHLVAQCPDNIDLHCLKSNAFLGRADSAALGSLAGWSLRSKIQMCISQWMDAIRGNNWGKHNSSLASLGSPQKCKSFIIWGRNWVRNAFASVIGWISSTINNPRGSIRGNQKRTVCT